MVNLLSKVIFVVLLFLVMVMYANEVETKEKEKVPEIKIYIYIQHIFLNILGPWDTCKLYISVNFTFKKYLIFSYFILN